MFRQSLVPLASAGRRGCLNQPRALLLQASQHYYYATLTSSLHSLGMTASTTINPTQQQHRHFSDRLLGHSPMAPKTPNIPHEEHRIPTERDVQIAGGVWNPTSAKRDKLGELKVELTEHQYTLDDAATPAQLRDLYLADGIQWISYTMEQCRLPEHTSSKPPSVAVDESTTASTLPQEMDPSQWKTPQSLLDVVTWMSDQETSIQSTVPEGQLTQDQWETYLDETIQKVDEVLATLPAGRYLTHVRDFSTVPHMVVRDGTEADKAFLLEQLTELQPALSASSEQQQLAQVGNQVLARYRLQLTRATCEHLKTNWEALTTLSDEALDRLAVQTNDTDGDESNQRTTLSLNQLNTVLRGCLTGNAIDRLDAMWDLVDRSGDGLLEKTDMEQAASFTVAPVQSAIVALFEDALEASPVLLDKKTQQQTASPEGDAKDNEGSKKASPLTPPKQGYFARRRETNAKKRLLKAFQAATTKHFADEIEMPQRLRCIYAWAEKAHQDNKIDSVLIEASGWSGRKRYVELHPKISLAEFREVQQIHLTHLDRIGWEITKSFREDLWVAQGKGRQNAELKRDCAIFLVVVSLVDYGIMIL